jgi:hypothetical protein
VDLKWNLSARNIATSMTSPQLPPSLEVFDHRQRPARRRIVNEIKKWGLFLAVA